jgi:hypothetical protein
MISISKILKEILEWTSEYQEEVDKIIAKGGTLLGQPGQYGAAYLLNKKAVKVTTDEVELEHAQILKGNKKTKYIAKIFEVEVVNPKLGIITMEALLPYKGKIPQSFINNVKKEAAALGIPPEELDLQPSNIMVKVVDGKEYLKMIDV